MDMQELSNFITAIPSDMEQGKEYQWRCPLCGGIVIGMRVEYNGHLHAGCNQCDIQIMQ